MPKNNKLILSIAVIFLGLVAMLYVNTKYYSLSAIN